ncbi:ABC transporter substrate-binding protein [Kitasatospora sp. NPDC088346]|uniref:ABC transporter substrate-binding protein n=1 Tax=Kitasatospora sp. NPDC088346 TaxID=3364073 RepID=UPI003813810A
MSARRRPAWAGGALALVMVAASALTSCSLGASREVVHVLGPWTGAEADDFRAVVAPFERANGITVDYQGSQESDSVLADRVGDGTPPDLAVFSGPGKLAKYARAGRLVGLDTLAQPAGAPAGEAREDGYDAGWSKLGAVDGTDYAVVVKASLKSLVWYSPRSLADKDWKPPQRWDGMVALNREVAAAGTAPWCVGLEAGSASGWPGTDWLEDIVLTQSGLEVYDHWTAGEIAWSSPRIRLAWQTWSELTASGGALRGGRGGALNTGFGDNGGSLLAHNPQCHFEHGGSFVSGFYRQYRPEPKAGEDFDFVRFPAVDPAYDGDVEVGGDLLAMFHDSPGARKLIGYLTSADAQAIWVSRGGALSPNREVPMAAYPDDLSRRLARTLLDARAVRFDASDQMPEQLQSAFYRAVLAFVDDPSRLDALLADLDRVQATVHG